MIKQVILVRDDLKMRKGKFAAQVAHASMKVFFDRKETIDGVVFDEVDGWHRIEPLDGQDYLFVRLNPSMYAWVFGTFAKIVLLVTSEEILLRAQKEARAMGIPEALITDLGFTEFHGQPTHTALAIGPDEADRIDLLTGPGGSIPTRLA
jgi:PTH2 family peptidyl-tRNA hydrolase